MVRETLYMDGKLFTFAPEYSRARPEARSEASSKRRERGAGSLHQWVDPQILSAESRESRESMEGPNAPLDSPLDSPLGARIEARDLIGTNQTTLSQKLSDKTQRHLRAQQEQFQKLRLESPLGQRVQSPDLGEKLAEQAHALLIDFSGHLEKMCEVAGENLAAVTQEYNNRIEILCTAAEADHNRLRALLLDLQAQYEAQKEAEARTKSDANDELTAFILRRANNPNCDIEAGQRMKDIALSIQRRGAALQTRLWENIKAAREALSTARATLARYLDLRCPLCETRFDSAAHLPLICAPCGHTLCSACLEEQTKVRYVGECLPMQYQQASCRQCGREISEVTLDRVLAVRVSTPQLDYDEALALTEDRLSGAEEVASSARFTRAREGPPRGP